MDKDSEGEMADKNNSDNTDKDTEIGVEGKSESITIFTQYHTLLHTSYLYQHTTLLYCTGCFAKKGKSFKDVLWKSK